jgi:hypothetical protein
LLVEQVLLEPQTKAVVVVVVALTRALAVGLAATAALAL